MTVITEKQLDTWEQAEAYFARLIRMRDAEIERLREREQTYRLALGYLVQCDDLPSSLKAIAAKALENTEATE